jgi:murein DD-endopeptidase MepM/ murein hydrolase activator NlpD
VLTVAASVALAGFAPSTPEPVAGKGGAREPAASTGAATAGNANGGLRQARLPNPLMDAPAAGGSPGLAGGGSGSDADDSDAWRVAKLQRGETLSRFGERTALGVDTARAMARAIGDVYSPRKLRSGHSLRFIQGPEGGLQEARYHIDQERFLAWKRDGDGSLDAEIREYPGTTRVREAYGRIESSLFRAGERAGLSNKLIMELAGIFRWDIDFARGLRKGDWFRVVYRQTFRDGEKVADGPILAAEFHNRGESHTAIRFTAADGRTDYYQPNGRAVRKAFLRSPVEFSRVTSGFSRSRKHPVLGYTRAHEGVDYGAPTGTPVRATGDGRVVHRGRQGGYGNVVKVRHAGGHYTTVYAHLSRYDSSAREGHRVEQGETIGYVGQSGLATGPHLHYEFHKGDRPRNPLRVSLPAAEPLPEKYRDTFAKRRHHMMAWLEAVGPEAEQRMARSVSGSEGASSG